MHLKDISVDMAKYVWAMTPVFASSVKTRYGLNKVHPFRHRLVVRKDYEAIMEAIDIAARLAYLIDERG